MDDDDTVKSTLDKTTEIVAAFVSKNQTTAADLPALIQAVHRALAGILEGAAEPERRKEPAVPVRRSITPDFLVSLEDGKKLKSLKRHLRTKYNLSPEEYRAKWGLPKDYPMVAPNYAAARSALAKEIGLGKGGVQTTGAALNMKAKRAPKAPKARPSPPIRA
jgi:predicted transcriptional regulator